VDDGLHSMFNYIQDTKSVPLRFSSLYKISTRGEKKRGEKIHIGRTGIKEGEEKNSGGAYIILDDSIATHGTRYIHNAAHIKWCSCSTYQ
jgi:hypothetical protein